MTEGAPGGGRFSPLADITRENVTSSRSRGRYRHGDFCEGSFPLHVNRGSAFESTPIVVDGRLFFTTPRNRVIALDPETGRELWTFDPQLEGGRAYANMWINRGVAYWRDPAGGRRRARERVFLATLDARLIALDAATGKPCAGFGAAGQVDLRAGIAPIYDDWEYNVTSPGTVVGDVIVVGSSIADVVRPDAPPGDVRAFDVRTRRAALDLPHRSRTRASRATRRGRRARASRAPRTCGPRSRRTSRAAWCSCRSARRAPTSTAATGPARTSTATRSSRSTRATGERKWHFQTVHHDLWDYDLAAPPVLVTLAARRARVDAVAQATKHGFVFVLDRETGAPLFPVEERPAPASDVPGERAWPTQPVPLAPPPLVPQRLDRGRSLRADARAPRRVPRAARRAAQRRPLHAAEPARLGAVSVHRRRRELVGRRWDPARQLLFVPVAEPRARDPARRGRRARHRRRSEDVKPLRGVTLGNLWWLLTGRGTGERYRLHPLSGRTVFRHDGVPCNRPPWGRLVGVDLARGTIAWSASTSAPTATPAYPATARRSRPRAASSSTPARGARCCACTTPRPAQRIATFELPAGLHAGPISYKLRPDGKQFLVVAPGGHIGIGSPLGDYVIAYTLP